jgi:hypothetical protein
MKTVVVLSRETILRAQAEICGCEVCSEDAEIIFDFILDEVTGRDALATNYFLAEPAKCPKCDGEIFEETLVEPAGMEPADRIYPSFLRRLK